MGSKNKTTPTFHRRDEDEEAQLQAALLASLVVSTSATSEVWRVRNGDSHEENTAEDWLIYFNKFPIMSSISQLL